MQRAIMSLLASVTEQRQQVLEFVGMPGGWMRLLGLLALLGLGYAVAWMYRREARVGAGARLRLALAGTRCLVLLALALIWLEPVIASYTARTSSATVAVLADVSASMSIVDQAGPEGPAQRRTRLEAVAELLAARGQAWLKRLAARNEVALYAFGKTAVRLPLARSGPGSPAIDLAGAAPAGQSATDLGQAVTAVMDDLGERPLAGMVILSDGRFNSGMPVADVAAAAGGRHVPLYTVGVGSPGEPPNVRVSHISAPAAVAKGDPFELRVGLSATGLGPTRLEVVLTVRALGDGAAPGGAGPAPRAGERVVASRWVTLGGRQATLVLPFTVEAADAGEFLYRARATPLAGEAVTSDNARAASVLVLDQQTRVLLVAGRPSYEYRYVTRLLEREATVELSCWLQSADAGAVRDGNRPLSELPRRREELFAYDAILLLDPDPAELDASWAGAVRRLVDEFGGGLLYQAGSHYAPRFLGDGRLEDLLALLPIAPDPEAEVRLSARGTYRTSAGPIRLAARAADHPLLAFSPDGPTNRSIWSALPGLWWYLPVLRPKPLATVLLEHGAAAEANRFGPAILMASQPFGAGRCVFLAFDGTWRWRSRSPQCFDRFWIRLARYLAQARRPATRSRGSIVLTPEVLDVGQYARLEARVLDQAYVPWQEPRLAAELQWADGSRRALTLEALPGREGWFATRVAFDRPGAAVLRVPLPAAPGAARPAEALLKRVLVRRPEIELRAVGMQAGPLVELARRSGGRYAPLARAEEVPEWIESATEVRVARGADVPLWDRAPVLLVIAALLSLEWALRRRNHLL